MRRLPIARSLLRPRTLASILAAATAMMCASAALAQAAPKQVLAPVSVKRGVLGFDMRGVAPERVRSGTSRSTAAPTGGLGPAGSPRVRAGEPCASRWRAAGAGRWPATVAAGRVYGCIGARGSLSSCASGRRRCRRQGPPRRPRAAPPRTSGPVSGLFERAPGRDSAGVHTPTTRLSTSGFRRARAAPRLDGDRPAGDELGSRPSCAPASPTARRTGSIRPTTRRRRIPCTRCTAPSAGGPARWRGCRCASRLQPGRPAAVTGT